MNFDVCIVGCGIIGSTTALELSRSGLRVIVIERESSPLRGSSLGGFGALTPFSDPFFVGETARLASESLQLYRNDWLNYLYKRTDTKIPIANTGLLQITQTKEYLEKEICRYKSNCIDGYRPEVIDESTLRAIEPNLTIDAVGALLHPEPWIDLQQYMGALEVGLSSDDNIDVEFNSTVLSVACFDEYVEVKTSTGLNVRVNQIILCTGIENLNLDGVPNFSMRGVRGDGISVRTKNNKPLFHNNIYCGDGFIAPRNTGEMLLGSTYVDEGTITSKSSFEDTISFEAAHSITNSTFEISSHLKNCTIERVWQGWRPASSDGLPIIGCSNSFPRVVYALGFLGLGITMSVAVASAISSYLKSGIDKFPESLSPDRVSLKLEGK